MNHNGTPPVSDDDWPDFRDNDELEHVHVPAPKADPDDQGWIVIPRWHEFQHYRNRDPEWIKSYTRQHRDDTYLALTSHQRAVLHDLRLAYASHDGHLALNLRSLSRHLALRVMTRDIEALNHAGFINILASKPLALSYQRASLEVEVEKEKERPSSSTTGQRQPPAAPAAKPKRVSPWNCSAPRVDERCDRGYSSADEYRRHLWIVHDLDLRKGELDPYLDPVKAEAELQAEIARAGG